MRIAVKEVGKPLEIKETNIIYRMECVKAFIGKENYTEFVRITPNGYLSMGVDEEGLPKGLPVNFVMAMDNIFYPVQAIVGTAVFVRVADKDYSGEIWDYEVGDLTDEDIALINSIIDKSEELSEKLRKEGKHL